jgi:hypothetical protein
MRKIYASQVRRWLRCEALHFLVDIVGIKEPVTLPLIEGIIRHQTAADMFEFFLNNHQESGLESALVEEGTQSRDEHINAMSKSGGRITLFEARRSENKFDSEYFEEKSMIEIVGMASFLDSMKERFARKKVAYLREDMYRVRKKFNIPGYQNIQDNVLDLSARPDFVLLVNNSLFPLEVKPRLDVEYSGGNVAQAVFGHAILQREMSKPFIASRFQVNLKRAAELKGINYQPHLRREVKVLTYCEPSLVGFPVRNQSTEDGAPSVADIVKFTYAMRKLEPYSQIPLCDCISRRCGVKKICEIYMSEVEARINRELEAMIKK